jgi:hypothetical protein
MFLLPTIGFMLGFHSADRNVRELTYSAEAPSSSCSSLRSELGMSNENCPAGKSFNFFPFSNSRKSLLAPCLLTTTLKVVRPERSANL